MLTFNGWSIDVGQRSVIGPAGAVELTSSQFTLLALFATNSQKILSRRDIGDAVYGRHVAHSQRNIDIMVLRLRRKIELDKKHPKFIKTIRHHGYYFTPLTTEEIS